MTAHGHGKVLASVLPRDGLYILPVLISACVPVFAVQHNGKSDGSPCYPWGKRPAIGRGCDQEFGHK